MKLPNAFTFKIAFAFLLLAYAMPTAAQTTQPSPTLGKTQDCSERKAVSIVQTDAEIAQFCFPGTNQLKHGCYFTLRSSDSKESTIPNLMWVVQASVISSFDEKGKPLFKPEDTLSAYLSKSCEIVGVLSPLKCTPRKGPESCPQ